MIAEEIHTLSNVLSEYADGVEASPHALQTMAVQLSDWARLVRIIEQKIDTEDALPSEWLRTLAERMERGAMRGGSVRLSAERVRALCVSLLEVAGAVAEMEERVLEMPVAAVADAVATGQVISLAQRRAERRAAGVANDNVGGDTDDGGDVA